MDNALSNAINQAMFQAQAPGAMKTAQTPDAITKTAKEFEAMFVSQMLNFLFEGVSADPLFGDKASSNIYRSLLVDEYGKKLSETAGFGISDQVRGELLKLQEAK